MPQPSLKTWCQLVRLPAVFTALPDIALGFLLTHATLSPLPEFLFLLAASVGLYLAGMAFNDVFDREVDARERPGRPIPSGRISVKAAKILAITLMAAGIGFAAAAGWQSLGVAILLAGMILAYDGLLKKFWIGPVAMGACRFLNVLLGASSTPGELFETNLLLVAAGLGVYIVGVTWFARTEAEISRKSQLTAAMAVVNAGFAILIWRVSVTPSPGPLDVMSILIVLAVVILTINRRLSAAIMDPSPRNVQKSIVLMLRSLIVLNATLIIHFSGELAYGLGTAALLFPMLALSYWMSIT